MIIILSAGGRTFNADNSSWGSAHGDNSTSAQLKQKCGDGFFGFLDGNVVVISESVNDPADVAVAIDFPPDIAAHGVELQLFCRELLGLLKSSKQRQEKRLHRQGVFDNYLARVQFLDGHRRVDHRGAL